MSFWRKLAYLLPSVRRRADQDIRDELEALRQLAEPTELGNLTVAAEDARGVLGWPSAERLAQHVHFGVRMMARYRAFTALVVTSLALGIGATTAIYSLMDAILIRALPVRDPQALVVMKWHARDYTLSSSGESWSTDGSSSDPATGLLASNFPFGALGVFQGDRDVIASAFGYFAVDKLALTVDGTTDEVKANYVTGGYFDGMGVRPVAGRVLGEADDKPGTSGVAMLSERFSRSHYGDPAAAIGRLVRVNDKPFTVVGITPLAFFGAEPGSTPDLYMPLHAQDIVDAGSAWTDTYRDDHFYWLEIMARLQPGVSQARAQAALAPRFHAFVASTATTDTQRQDLPALIVQPGVSGLDSLRRLYAQPLYILLAMAGLMLVIASTNVANLMLVRGVSRERELAIRLSVGATRARLIRQLLTESVLLGVVGGLCGLLVAWWGMRVLTALLSTGRTDFTVYASLNEPVLAVTASLAVLIGLLFGLAPALRVSGVDVTTTLKTAHRGLTRAHRRIDGRQILVVAQVALSFVLLFTAALFGRTLANLHAIPLGLERDNVLLFSLTPRQVGYRDSALLSVFEDVRDRLRALPGAENVSLSTDAPPAGHGTSAPVSIQGATVRSESVGGGKARAALATVGPDFFRTFRIPLRGRDFTASDSTGAPLVVIVNHRLADLFGLADPVGRTLTLGTTDYKILGIADDAVGFFLTEDPRAIAYFPYLQATHPPGQMVYEIRANNPLALAPPARDLIRQIDQRLAISDVQTEVAHIDQSISSQIALARLCSAFAGLALVLACVGVYGTVAFTVSRRTNELGIRMTLGAQRTRIIWMVVSGVLWMTVAGLAIGVPIVVAGSRFVKALLYGVTPTDPALFAFGLFGLVACAVVAGLIPARRAARIDPVTAIRQE